MEDLWRVFSGVITLVLLSTLTLGEFTDDSTSPFCRPQRIGKLLGNHFKEFPISCGNFTIGKDNNPSPTTGLSEIVQRISCQHSCNVWISTPLRALFLQRKSKCLNFLAGSPQNRVIFQKNDLVYCNGHMHCPLSVVQATITWINLIQAENPECKTGPGPHSTWEVTCNSCNVGWVEDQTDIRGGAVWLTWIYLPTYLNISCRARLRFIIPKEQFRIGTNLPVLRNEWDQRRQIHPTEKVHWKTECRSLYILKISHPSSQSPRWMFR